MSYKKVKEATKIKKGVRMSLIKQTLLIQIY